MFSLQGIVSLLQHWRGKHLKGEGIDQSDFVVSSIPEASVEEDPTFHERVHGLGFDTPAVFQQNVAIRLFFEAALKGGKVDRSQRGLHQSARAMLASALVVEHLLPYVGCGGSDFALIGGWGSEDTVDTVEVAESGHALIVESTFQSLGSSQDDLDSRDIPGTGTLYEHTEENNSEGSRCVFGGVLGVPLDNLEMGWVGNSMDWGAKKAVESLARELRNLASLVCLLLEPC